MDEQFNKLLTFLYITVYKQPVFRPISDKDFQYRNTEYVLRSFTNSHCDIVQYISCKLCSGQTVIIMC